MTDPRRLPELWTPPRPPAQAAEVMPRVEIEIRPQRPQSSTWRLYAIRDRGNRMLRERGYVLGGTLMQAHADAQRIALENGFIYKAPPDLGLPE